MDPNSRLPLSGHPTSPIQQRGVESALTMASSGPRMSERSEKACSHCRDRKMKCDVSRRGVPCTRCKNRQNSCTIPARRKAARKPRKVDTPSISVPDQVNPTLEVAKDDELQPAAPHVGLRMPWTIDQLQNGTSVLDLVKVASIYGDLTATTLRSAKSEPDEKPFVVPLPSYIKPLPQDMTKEDAINLWTKGAMLVPENGFRNKLIQSYVEHVHPSLPIVNLHSLLQSIDMGSQNIQPISLFLFQAILFTGTAFVDISDLQAAGFSTRKEARKAFYQRARLLYDIDSRNDRQEQVQALLLMTYWNEPPDGGEDGWHWLGVAISLAYACGLHRNPENPSTNVEFLRLRKRIWWCCVARDRLLALGTSRPPRIKPTDYDMPMLTIDDLDFRPLESESQILSPSCRQANCASIQKVLGMIFISKVELCLCIGHVLSTQYTPTVRDQTQPGDHNGKNAPRMHLVPKAPEDTQDVDLCEYELEQWLERLPAPCQYITQSSQAIAIRGRSIIIERAVLRMLYFATSSALHWPQLVHPGQSSVPNRSGRSQVTSWDKVYKASREITKTMLAMTRLGLSRYLPTTAVTILLTAIATYLFDIKSASWSTRDDTVQALSQCREVLQELRHNYGSADDAAQHLDAVIKNANINILAEESSKRTRRSSEMSNSYSDLRSTDGSVYSYRSSDANLVSADESENPFNGSAARPSRDHTTFHQSASSTGHDFNTGPWTSAEHTKPFNVDGSHIIRNAHGDDWHGNSGWTSEAVMFADYNSSGLNTGGKWA